MLLVLAQIVVFSIIAFISFYKLNGWILYLFMYFLRFTDLFSESFITNRYIYIIMKDQVSSGTRVFWFSFLLMLLIQNLNAKAKPSSAELIFTSTEISVNNGKMVTKSVFDLLINDRSADFLCKIRIPYSGIDKLVSLDASLHNADGSLVRKLSRNEITSQHNIDDYSLYEDQFVKIFTLRNSVYPYRIKWTYTIESSAFVNICDWTPVLMTEIPTRRATLTFISSEFFPVRIDSAGLLSTTYRKNKDFLLREYECEFSDYYDEEVFQASGTEHFPFVRIMPLRFHFETDGLAYSWKEFGLWIYHLNKGLNVLPKNEKEYIRVLKGEGLAELDLVRKIYNYLQDRTRYVNVTLKTGGLKPYPATYVSTNAYGDCKALSVYLMALLTEAGIHSDYVLLKAGNDEEDINTSFVSNQFNHAIVLVPAKNDSVWLDCTSDNPFGYTGTFIQGRHALVVGERGGSIVKIPALTTDQVALDRKGTIRLLANLPALVELEIEAGGELAENLRTVTSMLDGVEQLDIIGEIVRVSSFSVDSINLLPYGRHNQRMRLKYTGTSNSMLKLFGNELVCKLIPVDLPNFESPDTRVTSLGIPYPTCVSDSILLNIPPGYRIMELPAGEEIISEYGNYDFKYSYFEKGILFKRNFTLNPGKIPVENYTAFYSFIKQIRKIEASGFISFSKV